jgi:hypothetical protein
MTSGIKNETLDGISQLKIVKIIESLKDHSFQFKPA